MEKETFELLSSMSPKVKNCQKHFRKGATVLALRKSLRRSSIHDKSIHTTSNQELVINEISSNTTTASSITNAFIPCINLLNISPIIHDTDSDSDELKSNSRLDKFPQKLKANDSTDKEHSSLLANEKFENIKRWIDNVKLLNENEDNTIYSELPTICGDDHGTTTTASSITNVFNPCINLLNKTPIIIHDTDSDSDELKSNSRLDKFPQKLKANDSTDKEHSSLLANEKFENIKRWIDNVKLLNENEDNTIYSELSTICGDDHGANFVTERTGRAINSTVIGSAINFNELFKKQTEHKPNDPSITDDEDEIVDESYNEQDTSSSKSLQRSKTSSKTSKSNESKEGVDEDDVSNFSSSPISCNKEDNILPNNKVQSYLTTQTLNNINKKMAKSSINEDVTNKKSGLTQNSDLNEDLNKKYFTNENGSEHNSDIREGDYSDDSFSLNESLNTRLKNMRQDTKMNCTPKRDMNNACEQNPKSSCNGMNNDVEESDLASLLDDIYGNKWREKEEHVLPKSEPRNKMPMPKLKNLCITNTERKPVSIFNKNRNLEAKKTVENYIQKILPEYRTYRIKNITESPMLKRLNDICDSDRVHPRIKLNFNDSDCDDKISDRKETESKYFKDTGSHKKTESKKHQESDKENLDEFSFLGQSLEERIRKKINGIKEIQSVKKKEKKITDPGKKKTVASNRINKKTQNIFNRGEKIDIRLSSHSNSSNSDTQGNKNDTDSNRIGKKTKSSITKGKAKADNRKLSSTSNSSASSDDIWEKEISKIVHESKLVDGKYSFLASLSENIPILKCDMSARIYRNNFKTYKDQLLTKLFKLYNDKVFDNAIPQDTLLEWNDRMRATSGFCYCKKVTRRTGAVERTARIVLSTKVIDTASRLRDTLIHEMCHAATWIVNCVSDGHGPYWKSWAFKAMKIFPELPPIKRCHDYVINTKYTYKCTGCGYSIGRHSKSLDIERKRCGYCFGKFEVLINKISKQGETKAVPATPKKEATGFALFVKENYGVYKQGNLKHGEVMKLLGQKFQEMKLKPA